MQDFMLITRVPAPVAALSDPSAVDETIQKMKTSLSSAIPGIDWRLEFNLGGGRYVEVFSAPDAQTAMSLPRLASERGLQAEVSTLRKGW
jgi:hypothetical protein